EFADLFEERGGFDLIIGNPPWIKLEWKESNLLQDFSLIIALRNLSANETSNIRKVLLDNKQIRDAYIYEYELTSSIQGFLNAIQNYDKLSGGSVNLYKNFLPQSWMYGNKKGIIAFIHQENIFDDSNSGQFRAILYPKLRRHYHFINELRLFPEIHHSTVFSLNVYSNNNSSGFDCIFNLYTPNTIDQCYETTNNLLFGLKDDNNNWNVYGHKDRLIHVGNDKLRVFAKLFDDNENVNEARLAVIHAKQLLSVLKKLLFEEKQDIKSFSTLLWTETSAQSNGLIKRVTHYPDIPAETILLGAQIYNTNPLFKCARANSSKNSDYDIVDLRKITDYYLPRCNYSIFTSRDVYRGNLPTLPWGGNYDDTYKIFARKMIDPQGERTLVSCIVPPGISHTDGIRGVAYNDLWMLCYISGLWSSIPYDFIVKTLRKENFTTDTIDMLPIPVTKLDQQIVQRTLMLNALTKYYADLWESVYSEEFKSNSWAKDDKRLSNTKFKMCSRNWSSNNVLKSDFERRQAQIEIDVLVAMALGLTLEELKTIYRIQFSVLKKYENDTWYDQNGRIVFSVKNLGNATYKRPEWNEIKDAKSGTFTRTIIDDTMPGGPIERTIEYVAPFDRCDREQDYEIAWAFFEERFKDKDK
ncbi:MAG: class I SAM-dependent DNA methyltransferase, partial [Desulfitobacteriaceae bacterium]|nr:class I SAM-dependent DNA methyltransferase [Desulfitobacteriaceae bacterium]